MNAYKLYDCWKNSNSHFLVSKYMKVFDESHFAFSQIKINYYSFDKIGIHIEFKLDGIDHFVAITEMGAKETIKKTILNKNFYDIEFIEDDKGINLLLINEGKVEYRILCISLSLGPVHSLEPMFLKEQYLVASSK